MSRNIRAVLIASIASAARANIALWLCMTDLLRQFDNAPPRLLAGGRVVSVAFNMLVGSSIGLAWRHIPSGHGWASARAYWSAAALAGLLPAQLLFLQPVQSEQSIVASVGWWAISVFGASLGGLTSVFAWIIGRPDRDAGANPVSTAP